MKTRREGVRSADHTVRPWAPPRLSHPPIFRALSGLWASSSNNYNYSSKVHPLCLRSRSRRLRARLCSGSTCLSFLKRRSRGRIKSQIQPVPSVYTLCQDWSIPPRVVLIIAYRLLRRPLYRYPLSPRSGVVNNICPAITHTLPFGIHSAPIN